MKAIIFGVKGQDGFYLSTLLINNGIEVIGLTRETRNASAGEDISNYLFVVQLIKSNQPDYVFHLAANSTTRHDTLFENYQTIATGTLNILEAVYQYSKHTKVFISGSGLQFVNNGDPISEKDPFETRDSYSMARIQSAFAARYFRNLGVRVYIGFFFNHDSPLRPERHVNQKIVFAAQKIANGNTDQLLLGDISVKKEFTFAGDVAEAIWKFINNEYIFETVIGSGKAFSIAYWLEFCFDFYNLNWKNYVSISTEFVVEYRILVSDPATLYSLGWEPKVSIEQLAIMMLKHQQKLL